MKNRRSGSLLSAASGRRRRMMAVSERLRSPKELLGRISRRLPAPRPCSPVPPAARVALVVLGFFQVSSAFAVPIAEWGGPWQVTLGRTLGFAQTSIGDDERSKEAFGLGAKDGQITNVGSFFEPLGGGSPAIAKADGFVSAGSCIIACNHFFGDAAVDFDRAFRLEGSPSGQWSVDLVTALDGEIFALGDGNPRSIVGASVTIATLSDPATTLLGTFFHYDVTDDDLIIRETVGRPGFFNDGTYLVQGSIVVNTDVSEERCSCGGVAEANFFDLGPDFG